MGMDRACKYNFVRKSLTDVSFKAVTQDESSNTVIMEILFASVKGTEFSELFSAIVNGANLSLLASRPNFEFLSLKLGELFSAV
jgi:hypothetical protein